MQQGQRRIQGAIGAKPPPLDQWNQLISGEFHAPTGAVPPTLKEKNTPPPGQIPEYAPGYLNLKKQDICLDTW